MSDPEAGPPQRSCGPRRGRPAMVRAAAASPAVTRVPNASNALAPPAGGDAPSWGAFAAGNVFASHGWRSAVEQSGIVGLAPCHLPVERGGRLVAATICQIVAEGCSPLDPRHLLLGRVDDLARRIGLSFLPALVVAPYRG